MARRSISAAGLCEGRAIFSAATGFPRLSSSAGKQPAVLELTSGPRHTFRVAFVRRDSRSELFARKGLAVEGGDRAVAAFRVRNVLDGQFEVDG